MANDGTGVPVESVNEAGEASSEMEGAAPGGGNYEVIRQRLNAQARELGERVEQLNQRRQEVFGGTELRVLQNLRVRTENNCVPCDMVNVGGRLLFGYNVFIGLKKDTAVADVFSLYDFERNGEQVELHERPREGGFLADPSFLKEFTDLYRYYRDTHLLQVRMLEGRLLGVFQTGPTPDEVKVFRWRPGQDGELVYVDSRGDRDHVFPRSHDFEWTPTTRDDQVQGRHPHLSILDEVFVETTGGDLTIKVENNTESGRGVYSEPVDDPNQALDDGEVAYASVGPLLLLKIRPFREERFRYLVFNRKTQEVRRIDAIGLSCRELPEDHGIVFPGGYYLESGEHKIFDPNVDDLLLERVVRSPNGEDVAYVFHRVGEGRYVIMPYNLIRKEALTPIQCHGFSLFDDGTMLVFRGESDEPSRIHPMQVWQTPFTSADHAATAVTDGSFLSKVGNAELVRGISEAFGACRLAQRERPTRQTYEELIGLTGRVLDAYYWLDAEEVALAEPLRALRETSERIVDEFEKVQAMRARAEQAVAEARAEQEARVEALRREPPSSVTGFMDALTGLRHERGHLISLRELRYVDLAAIDVLEEASIEQFERLSMRCVEFLLEPDALRPIGKGLERVLERARGADRVADVKPLVEEVQRIGEGLDVVSEVVSGLEVDDTTARTSILEAIGEVYAHLNRVRAQVESRRKELAVREGRAEFGAQFKLLGQAVASALTLADTPERCDEQLSRLMVQLEELEARFGELDEFLGDIAAKREEIYDALTGKKQALLDDRQRRAESLFDAAKRILDGVARRARSFTEQDELNAYFAADAMILKLRRTAEQLGELGDAVKAEEVESRLATARQDALRSLRDKVDLFEEGGELIKFGQHRFRINTQPLELTMVPRDGGMALHLTGTEYYEAVSDEAFAATRPYWDQELVSETPDVYRGEYLAASILFDAEAGREGLSVEALHEAERSEDGLLGLVQRRAVDRYDEGYERGVHDADAAAILEKLLALYESAGLLRFPPTARAYATLYWAFSDDEARKRSLALRARSLGRLRGAFGPSREARDFAVELGEVVRGGLAEAGLDAIADEEAQLAGQYLAEELADDTPRFAASSEAIRVRDALLRHLDLAGSRARFEEDLRQLTGDLRAALSLTRAWVRAFLERTQEEALTGLGHVEMEVAALLLADGRLEWEASSALTQATVEGLFGQHPRVREGRLDLRLEEVLERLGAFVAHRVPGFRAYRARRHELLEREKNRLRVEELKPKVMSAFVRNRLVNDVYLPLVGDNLAKQLGAAGDAKRSDRMGLLLLVSPPGYGKTTLMEYVASRLGLVFVKVNGPALGHGVTSLDPAEAPNATARQEVNKINLALEMGNNVMLYLDDIQHTHPELLQKFISLCDGQRRIEGVWNDRTRTYDLRGKRFCVVMAGNPYTESGAKFQIPDMLANRADTYNLGDVLEGKEEAFALSYVENALTSNPVLVPLSTRDYADVYRVVRMARGEQVPASELSHGYGAAELNEMVDVFQHLFRVRDVLLQVNLMYIESAAQEDAFRTEPPFKLQGSYRNMNKLAEKVVPAMDAGDLERLLDDHYAAESQTLTTGAEANLLKLGELRGRLGEEERARWAEIKSEFRRLRSQGGADDDPVTRVTGTLGGLGRELEGIRQVLGALSEGRDRSAQDVGNGHGLVEVLSGPLALLEQALRQVARPQLEVTVHSEPPAGVTELLAQQVSIVERTLVPLVRSTTQNLDDAQALQRHVTQLLELIRKVDQRLREAAGE